MPKPFKGPRLGTKLVLSGLILLVIPYLGTQSLRAMKSFLFDGQAQAQLLTAQGIATLLRNRPELFNDLPPSLEGYAELPLYPLENNIQLDAFNEEWGEAIMRKSQSFSGNGIYFQLVLGEREGDLYGMLEVNDSTPVNRNPGLLRLNHSDHVRFYCKDTNGEEKRIELLFEGSGRTTAYYVDESWNYAINNGQPEYRIQGYVQRRSDSYTLEFKIPLSLLDGRQIGIAVADAYSEAERSIDALTGTFPTLGDNPYNLMVLRSPQLEDILNSIATSNSRVWILDGDRRVRAISGNLEQTSMPDYPEKPENAGITDIWQTLVSWVMDRFIGMPEGEVVDFDPALTYTRDDAVLKEALAGIPSERRRQSLDDKTLIITAAYPIYSDDFVIGAVMLEQSTQHILRLQSNSLERVASQTLLSLVAVILAMLLFSARLAWRIRQLGRETSQSIDAYGRLQGLRISRDLKAGDEIGDLARNINLALERLNQHQEFLANIPRTLRHEINNPLNTISTSLDNLEQVGQQDNSKLENPNSQNPNSQIPSSQNPNSKNRNDGKLYLDSARRGLTRISAIVGKLADAASLEEALNTEEMSEFDLSAMLKAYVQNQQKLDPKHKIVLTITDEPLFIYGSDIHIEQLLDKLLDNARDFSEADAPIIINLFVRGNYCELQVINRGPLLDKADTPHLFQMMHSKRHDKTPGHFGLGLYVARVIAEHHGGSISAKNIPDGSGPCFRVRLPLL